MNIAQLFECKKCSYVTPITGMPLAFSCPECGSHRWKNLDLKKTPYKKTKTKTK